jgi:Domain of unknown function (DUF4189)
VAGSGGREEGDYMTGKIGFSLLLLVILLLRSHHGALAFGAVAEGIAKGANGSTAWSFGAVVDKPDEQTAKDAALETCKKNGGVNSRKLCHLIMTFENKCVASSEDPKNGTPGIGWAVSDAREQAIAEAISRCQSTAGPDRRSFCQTSHGAVCDGTAKK